MFDLFRSSDKVKKYFLSGLLLLVALSMVTYLIPSYGSGDRGADAVVAEIGKDTLTLRDAQLAIQNATRNRSIPPSLLSLYVPQMIEQMVTDRSLVYEAHRLGLQVSDDDISNTIRLSAPTLFPGGNFVGRDAYSAMLAQEGKTIPEFESEVAQQVLLNRLREVVVEGTVVTPAEVEREFRHRNDKVKVEYVKISPEKLKSEVHVTPAEVKAYYDKNPALYPVPEKRSLAILVLDQAKMEQSVQPSEAELRRAYESDKDRFRTPERVKVRHILLNTAGKSPEEEAKIKAKAEDLLKQIKGGGNFAELARKNSEDPGSAAKGGELDWVVRGQTVKPFEDSAFSLKPNEISNLVKTQYGYHILQVEEHQPAHLRSFDEARSQITDELRKQRANQIMQDLPDHVEAALKKDPPAKVAQDLNLAPPIMVENAGPGDAIPGIGVNKDFETSISGLKKGEISQAVAVPPNRVVMAVVTGVSPTHPASFEEAEARIRKTLEEQKASELASARAAALATKTKAMNGDLEKAAKSMGLEVKTPEPFNRQGAVEGLGTAGYVAQAFDKPDSDIIGPVNVPDGRIVAKVLSHLPADLSQLPAERAGLLNELKGRKARERNDLFQEGLRERLIKEGKVKIHQDVVNRLVANYRG